MKKVVLPDGYEQLEFYYEYSNQVLVLVKTKRGERRLVKTRLIKTHFVSLSTIKNSLLFESKLFKYFYSIDPPNVLNAVNDPCGTNISNFKHLETSSFQRGVVTRANDEKQQPILIEYSDCTNDFSPIKRIGKKVFGDTFLEICLNLCNLILFFHDNSLFLIKFDEDVVWMNAKSYNVKIVDLGSSCVFSDSYPYYNAEVFGSNNSDSRKQELSFRWDVVQLMRLFFFLLTGENFDSPKQLKHLQCNESIIKMMKNGLDSLSEPLNCCYRSVEQVKLHIEELRKKKSLNGAFPKVISEVMRWSNDFNPARNLMGAKKREILSGIKKNIGSNGTIKPKLITVAGGSGSGKTRILQHFFPEYKVLPGMQNKAPNTPRGMTKNFVVYVKCDMMVKTFPFYYVMRLFENVLDALIDQESEPVRRMVFNDLREEKETVSMLSHIEPKFVSYVGIGQNNGEFEVDFFEDFTENPKNCAKLAKSLSSLFQKVIQRKKGHIVLLIDDIHFATANFLLFLQELMNSSKFTLNVVVSLDKKMVGQDMLKFFTQIKVNYVQNIDVHEYDLSAKISEEEVKEWAYESFGVDIGSHASAFCKYAGESWLILRELFHWCYDEEILEFNETTRKWEMSEEPEQKTLEELMDHRVEELSQLSKNLLNSCACLANYTKFEVVDWQFEGKGKYFSDFYHLISDGFVTLTPKKEIFFVNDSFRVIIRKKLGEKFLNAEHRRIGFMFHNSMTKVDPIYHMFALNQLHFVDSSVLTESEKDILVELNFNASNFSRKHENAPFDDFAVNEVEEEGENNMEVDENEGENENEDEDEGEVEGEVVEKIVSKWGDAVGMSKSVSGMLAKFKAAGKKHQAVEEKSKEGKTPYQSKDVPKVLEVKIDTREPVKTINFVEALRKRKKLKEGSRILTPNTSSKTPSYLVTPSHSPSESALEIDTPKLGNMISPLDSPKILPGKRIKWKDTRSVEDKLRYELNLNKVRAEILSNDYIKALKLLMTMKSTVTNPGEKLQVLTLLMKCLVYYKKHSKIIELLMIVIYEFRELFNHSILKELITVLKILKNTSFKKVRQPILMEAHYYMQTISKFVSQQILTINGKLQQFSTESDLTTYITTKQITVDTPPEIIGVLLQSLVYGAYSLNYYPTLRAVLIIFGFNIIFSNGLTSFSAFYVSKGIESQFFLMLSRCLLEYPFSCRLLCESGIRIAKSVLYDERNYCEAMFRFNISSPLFLPLKNIRELYRKGFKVAKKNRSRYAIEHGKMMYVLHSLCPNNNSAVEKRRLLKIFRENQRIMEIFYNLDKITKVLNTNIHSWSQIHQFRNIAMKGKVEIRFFYPFCKAACMFLLETDFVIASEAIEECMKHSGDVSHFEIMYANLFQGLIASSMMEDMKKEGNPISIVDRKEFQVEGTRLRESLFYCKRYYQYFEEFHAPFYFILHAESQKLGDLKEHSVVESYDKAMQTSEQSGNLFLLTIAAHRKLLFLLEYTEQEGVDELFESAIGYWKRLGAIGMIKRLKQIEQELVEIETPRESIISHGSGHGGRGGHIHQRHGRAKTLIVPDDSSQKEHDPLDELDDPLDEMPRLDVKEKAPAKKKKKKKKKRVKKKGWAPRSPKEGDNIKFDVMEILRESINDKYQILCDVFEMPCILPYGVLSVFAGSKIFRKRYDYRLIGKFAFKNIHRVRHTEHVLYEVFQNGKYSDTEMELFKEHLILFSMKNFGKSVEILQRMEKSFIVEFYIEVCHIYSRCPLPKDWSGHIPVDENGRPKPFEKRQGSQPNAATLNMSFEATLNKTIRTLINNPFTETTPVGGTTKKKKKAAIRFF